MYSTGRLLLASSKSDRYKFVCGLHNLGQQFSTKKNNNKNKNYSPSLFIQKTIRLRSFHQMLFVRKDAKKIIHFVY